MLKYTYKGIFNPEKLEPTNIDRQSLSLIPENSKVLELGCADGFMSRYLKGVKNCRLVGVEIDSQLAKKARRWCQEVIVGDIDKKETWQEIKKFSSFDIVFASSIIEHLKDPYEALKNIRWSLKKRGILVITTCNIAHWRMRLQLLLGRWQYEEYGLLDNTHLRFFTYKTFIDLIKRSGFKVEDIGIDPAGGLKYFNWLLRKFPNLYAYQMVVKARK